MPSLFTNPPVSHDPVPAPVIPDVAAEASKLKLEDEKKRLKRAQGIESTDLAGSMGVLGTPFPGLKNTMG